MSGIISIDAWSCGYGAPDLESWWQPTFRRISRRGQIILYDYHGRIVTLEDQVLLKFMKVDYIVLDNALNQIKVGGGSIQSPQVLEQPKCGLQDQTIDERRPLQPGNLLVCSSSPRSTSQRSGTPIHLDSCTTHFLFRRSIFIDSTKQTCHANGSNSSLWHNGP